MGLMETIFLWENLRSGIATLQLSWNKDNNYYEDLIDIVKTEFCSYLKGVSF